MELAVVIFTVSSLFTGQQFVIGVRKAKKAAVFNRASLCFLQPLPAFNPCWSYQRNTHSLIIYGHDAQKQKKTVQANHKSNVWVLKCTRLFCLPLELNMRCFLLSVRKDLFPKGQLQFSIITAYTTSWSRLMCVQPHFHEKEWCLTQRCLTLMSAAGWEADDVVLRWRLLNTWTWTRSTSLTIQWSAWFKTLFVKDLF